DGKRQHLFVVPAAGGPTHELTAGDQDAPAWRLLEPLDYAFAGDSRGVVYSSKLAKGEALRTHTGLWVPPTSPGKPPQLPHSTATAPTMLRRASRPTGSSWPGVRRRGPATSRIAFGSW